MKLKKLATKAAIFIAIFTIGFYITFSTVDAFKITVINFFIEQKENLSTDLYGPEFSTPEEAVEWQEKHK